MSAAQKKALEIVISITKERLAHSYSPRNSNRSDGNGRYTMDQQKARARYLNVYARLRDLSLGSGTATGADCGAAG